MHFANQLKPAGGKAAKTRLLAIRRNDNWRRAVAFEIGDIRASFPVNFFPPLPFRLPLVSEYNFIGIG